MVKDIPRVAANGVGARCVRRGGRGPKAGPVMSAPKARVGSVLRKTGRFGNPWRSPVGSLDRNRDLQPRMVHIRARTLAYLRGSCLAISLGPHSPRSASRARLREEPCHQPREAVMNVLPIRNRSMVSTTALDRQDTSRLQPFGRFALHLAEMCAVMCPGTVTRSVPAFGAAGRLRYTDPFQQHPELSVLALAINMSVPMAVWRSVTILTSCGELQRAHTGTPLATRTLLHHRVGGGDDRQGEAEPVKECLVDLSGEAATDLCPDDDRRRQEQVEPQRIEIDKAEGHRERCLGEVDGR